MTTCIILPTYNERENLERLVQKIAALHLQEYELCVVDDASPDGTSEVAHTLSQKYPIHVCDRPGKLGLGSAYIEGFRYAMSQGARTIITMDCDLSHDPDDLPRLLEAARHADLVIGSRRVKGGSILGWSWVRTLASAGAMMISRTLLGIQTHDVTSGYRCYRRETLERIPLASIQSNGYSFLEEILYLVEHLGLRVVEVPVCYVDRTNGKSKLGTREIVKFFITIVRLKYGARAKT